MKTNVVAWIVGGVVALGLIVMALGYMTRPGEPTVLPTGEVIAEAEPVITLPFVNPTPLSEKEKAVRALRVLDMEPTGEALAEAAGNGATSMIDLLLKGGVLPDAADGGGCPAIVRAALESRIEAVTALLKAGAKPDLADAEGRTALVVAVQKGNRPLAEELIAGGADANQVDTKGHGLLHHAVIYAQPEIVSWLLETHLPTQMTECCEGERGIVSHALDTGNAAIMTAILEASQPVAWNRQSRALLLSALRKGDRPLITLLLRSHEGPPTLEGAAQPLLAYAVAWGKADLLTLLLECGADPNALIGSPVEPAFAELIKAKVPRHYVRTEQGMTPLMLAAGMGDLACVKALVKHGARRGSSTKKWKLTALSLAARGKHHQVMQVLLGKSYRPEDQRVRVEISLSQQRATLWRDGQIIHSSRISSGRSGYATPSGQFVVTDKHKNRVSNIYNVNMPYFMRLDCSDIGMHAGVVPNYPASHGCIRLPRETAIRFFREVEVGTMVTIR